MATDTVEMDIPPGAGWHRVAGPIAGFAGLVKIHNAGSSVLMVNSNPSGDPSARDGSALPPSMSYDGGDRVPVREDWIETSFDGAATQLWLKRPDGSGGPVSIMFGDP